MPKQLRCHCAKNPVCKLCRGAGFYAYEPGERGWQPFICPTCEGAGSISDPSVPEGKKACPTCKGTGKVDPANPANGGIVGLLYKIFMGA